MPIRLDKEQSGAGGGGGVTPQPEPERFTILYPNNGTEAAPANIKGKSTYYMPNPFPNKLLSCQVQVLYSGFWVETGWYATSLSVARGVAAGQRQSSDLDLILVQTGASGLLERPEVAGNVSQYYGVDITELPCRVLVWRLN